MRISHASFAKSVTTAGVPEALSATSAMARGARVRAADANTDVVYLSPVSGGETVEIGVGGEYLLNPAKQWIDLADYVLDSAVNGEGVQVWYWFGQPTGGLALESKVEAAAVKLIDALASEPLFDGVTVTAGLTTSGQALNAVVAYVPRAEQSAPGRNNWRVVLEVSVMTQIGQDSDHASHDMFTLHRARTEAIRALFLVKHVPQSLATVQPGLSCVPNSLMEAAELESEMDEDERRFVSRSTIAFIAHGTDA